MDSSTVQETKYNYECNYGGKVSLIQIHNTNLEKGGSWEYLCIYIYKIYLHIFF